MARLVRPQTLRGFRDMLPDEMIVHNDTLDKIRRVYERYGYLPIDTPVLERLPNLVGTGGDETDKQIFTLESPEHQAVGMRFDLTVPFARIVAQYNPARIRLPFRCYHVGPAFRSDDPQPEQGRFRQFTQFDIDIAGTSAIAADAEIVAVVSDAFQAVGLSSDQAPENRHRYFIRVNNRRIVDAFLLGLEIYDPSVAQHVMRVIDKRDKLTDDDLVAELGEGRTDASGDPIRGVCLEPAAIRAVMDFISIEAGSRTDVMAALEKSVEPGPEKDSALAEVVSLCQHLDALGVADEAARLDPSLARGLDYYTNTVFEGILPDAGVGSVMGGGRYDDLVNRFLDDPISATGASIGVDRLVAGLGNLGLAARGRQNTAQVMVLVMPGVPETEASRLAAELRSGGVATELYLGDAMGKVGRQLGYANARGLSVAVLVGASELAQGTAAVKDLREGSGARAGLAEHDEYLAAGTAGQQTVRRGELVATVRRLLAAAADQGESRG
jgi:histidyl-tRNA synthetase